MEDSMRPGGLLANVLRGGGVWFAGALLTCLRASPQTASAAAPVEIDIPVLAAGYGSRFFEDTARQFEKQRPDIRVHLAGDARIHEKVRIRVMTGDVPDATDAVLLYETLIANHRILDLTPYLDGPNWENDGRWRDSFMPGVLQRWTRAEDKIYGIPFAYAVWTVYYDRNLFAQHGWQPPKTWNDFFRLCDAIKAQGIPPLAFPGVYMRYADAFLRAAHYNLVGPQGYKAYNELAPGARTDPRFIRAATVTQRLVADYSMAGWEGMTHTDAQTALLQRRAAMNISAWFVSEMKDFIPKDFSLGTFNLPVFPDGITSPDTLQAQAAYYFLFETGDARREKATVDFFRYLTSRERARAFARLLQAPVAIRAVQPGDYTAPAMQEVARLLQRASSTFDAAPPASAAFQALFNQSMTDARYRLLTRQITPEQFGEQLERAADNERRRMENPDEVDHRHVLAATVLLFILSVAALGLVGRTWRRRLAARGHSSAGHGFSSGPPLRARFAATFVGPAFLLFAALVLLPGFAALVWAFFRWDGFSPRVWAGTFNFRWLLFESDAFWFSLRNNLFVMLVPTLFVVPTALFFAALLHRGVRGAGFFRSVFLFPNLLGGIAATLLWMNAYSPHGGLINAVLVRLGDGLHLPALQSFQGFAWLSQSHLYWALVPIYLWMACGFNLVLYLAAMQGINPELYEAAEIEGASPLRQFFTITLPLITDVLATSAVFIVIAGLNTFEMIWLLTSQDPVSSSHVLSTLMVFTLFREFEVGRATAIAVVLFVLVFLCSAWVLRGFSRSEEVRE